MGGRIGEAGGALDPLVTVAGLVSAPLPVVCSAAHLGHPEVLFKMRSWNACGFADSSDVRLELVRMFAQASLVELGQDRSTLHPFEPLTRHFASRSDQLDPPRGACTLD